jgi:site-specific DNA recombinase
MGNKAIIYCRVSTSRQADDELPIESQLDSCEKKAADLNLSIDKVFLDEGISASSDQRPAFQDAITYCEVFEIDYFITWSSSRFARNKRDASFYKDRLVNCGTKVIYVSMDIDINTTPGWMLDGMLELMDEYYSRQTSADTKRSMMQNAKQGFWNGGNVPYGYEAVPSPVNPKRKTLQPIDSEADIVNIIFSLKADRGYGARQIVKKLNKSGYTRRGHEWKLNTVADLLKNRTVIGQTVFGKRPRGKRRVIKPEDEWIIIDSHPPLISRDLFDLVQKRLTQETPVYTKENAKHVLTGMITCAECNDKMHIESASGRSQKYYYYFCRSAKLSGNHQYKRYRADKIDQSLLSAVNSQIFNPVMISEIIAELRKLKSNWDIESSRQIDSLQDDIDALAAKNQNLTNVLEQLGTDAVNLESIISTIQANTEKINNNKVKIRALNKTDSDSIITDIDPEVVSGVFNGLLDNADDPSALRQFLKSFIKNVTLGEGCMSVDYEPMQIVSNPVHISNGWLPGPAAVGTRRIVIDLPETTVRRRKRA